MPPSEDHPIAVIVDREGLGDALLKLPMLRALNREFGNAPIWWIASHQTDMAGTLRPYVEGMIAQTRDHTNITNGGKEAWAALPDLPSFAAVFDTRSRVMSVWRARRQLRPRAFYCALPGFLLSSRRPPGRWTRPDHIGERAFSLAQAAIGRAADGRGTLPFAPSATALVRNLLAADRPAIGLAIGSREARKNWPLENFIALAAALVQRGLRPAFLVGPQEAAWVPMLQDRVPQAVCMDFTALQPADPLGALDPVLAAMQELALVVANDGGLGHLAAAMDRPVVSLFGPTDPARWAPMAAKRIVIRAQEHGGDTMDHIPLTAVLTATEQLLGVRPAMS